MASLVESQGYAGDEGNFEALYSTYNSDVRRLASYLLRNASDAEDASQTVFLNVLRALRQGVRPSDPRAWLLAITRNVCFSRRRAAACRPGEVELDLERAPGPHDDDIPTAEDIVGALSRMRPNQRTALILRDFRGAPRSEICELLSLSPTGVETLLTRARTSFREEIQAGEQPFDCAETKALVEQQLAGEITVSERHSLRTHLRHCAPCSTLARAVRSSRGKLAGLVFWPGELFSRLASAFSQAPTVAHVAAAVTSTAAIATIAIPVAVTNSSQAAHVEGRTAPAHAVQPAAAPPSRATAATSISLTSFGPIARAHAHAPASHRTRVTVRRATAKTHAAARAAAPSDAPATTAPGTAAPVTSSPVQASPPGAAPAPATQPVAVPPRSPSPAVRPTTKPRAKPKPAVKPRRRSGGRHPTDPADVMPVSGSPGSSLVPPGNSGPSTAGPGATVSSASTSSSTAQASGSSSSSSQGSSGGNNGGAATGGSSGSSGSAGGSSSGHGHKHKH